MNPQKWQQIKEIFGEAVELSAANGERERFLRSQAAADSEIIREVRRLLAADEKNDSVNPMANVAHLWRDDGDEDDAAAEDLTGRRIGDYRIVREIGRGGMGVVFEARREAEDFSQTIALKILRGAAADSTEIARRFRRERQILAVLEHPHIARMLDGGRGADGTPFLAMEFVAGKPVAEFCGEKNLNVNERLRLFLQICDAVSFAHSRLVVHRDLKPSNILVTDDGAVKLLDFGISKILSDEENAEKNRTLTGFAMMTPQYASPEQIRGETLATASDIYTLGLILYELLTGAPAYDFPNFRADEMAKIIAEVELVRPSFLVSRPSPPKSGDTSENKGQRTNHKPQITNPKLLRGDLDNIVLKALRKEPSRRYASVEQLAGDIRRHLEGLPVTARPDTAAYRLEKFVKRHRAAVIAVILIFLTLIGGIAATTWQAVRARRQQALAEQRFNQVRELGNNIVFKYYAEAEKLPNSTVIRQMFVDDSLAYFDNLAQDASADDRLKSELARTFLQIGKVQGLPTSPNLGNTAGAIANYRKGIELLEPLAEKSQDTLLQGDLVRACAEYAVVLRQNGNTAESGEAFEKAVRLAEKFLTASPGDENLFVKITPAYLFFGDALPVGAGAGENIPVFDRVIAESEKFLRARPDHLKASNYLVIACERKGAALLTLAANARETGEFEAEKKYLGEAGKLFERYVEISETLVRLYPENIIAPALLASAKVGQAAYFTETGDYQKALANLRASFDFYNPLLEKDDAHVGLKTYVADIEQRFGIVFFRLGETGKAETHFARAFELMDKAIETDPNNFDFIKQRAEMKFNRADEFLRRKDAKNARRFYEAAFGEIYETARAKDSAYAESVRANYHEKLGGCFLQENLSRNARDEYDKAMDIRQKIRRRICRKAFKKTNFRFCRKKSAACNT